MDEELNKSIEDLEKVKIQAETDLINARIKKEFTDKLPSWHDKIANFFKKWNAVILALITIFGGIWGIVLPVRSYLEERSKSVQLTLNENMIKAMENLNSPDWYIRDNAIMVLSYYDLNAIPIFLNNLELSTDDSQTKQYIEAINLIYKRKKSGIVDRINVKIEYSFNRLFVSDSSYDETVMRCLQNLSQLTNDLNLDKPDREKVKSLYKTKILPGLDSFLNKNTSQEFNLGPFKDLILKLIDSK